MIGYRNLLISLFCSMAVSAAGQPRLVKSLVPDMPSQLLLHVEFTRLCGQL